MLSRKVSVDQARANSLQKMKLNASPRMLFENSQRLWAVGRLKDALSCVQACVKRDPSMDDANWFCSFLEGGISLADKFRAIRGHDEKLDHCRAKKSKRLERAQVLYYMRLLWLVSCDVRAL